MGFHVGDDVVEDAKSGVVYLACHTATIVSFVQMFNRLYGMDLEDRMTWMTDDDWALCQRLRADRHKRERFTDTQIWDAISDLYRRINPDLAKDLESGLRKLSLSREWLDFYLVNLTVVAVRNQLIATPG